VVTGEQDVRRAAKELAAAMQQLYDSIEAVAKSAGRLHGLMVVVSGDSQSMADTVRATDAAIALADSAYCQLRTAITGEP